MALFKSGVRNKVMASHKLNMSSSRSHAILTVNVTAGLYKLYPVDVKVFP
jgi:hypothetical protein